MTSVPDSALTTLANGSYLSVWTADSNAVWGQISNARTSAKGPVFSVAPAKAATVSHLSATELSNGRFVVVWEETDGAGKHTIQARLFGRDSAAVSDTFEIGASSANRTSPNVIADASGGFSVVAGDGNGVTRVNVNAAGLQSAPKVLMDEGLSPSVAILRDGSVMTVAASAADGGGYEIIGVAQGADGPITMSKVLAIRNEPWVPHPTVAGLANGTFVVSWEGEVDGKQSVLIQAYESGGIILGRASNFTPTSADQTFSSPVLQMLPGGGYAYAFSGGKAGNMDVFLGFARSEFSFLSADQVDAGALGSQGDPSLALLRDGRHVLTWIEQSASGSSIRSKILDERTAAINITGTDGNDDYLGTTFGDTLTGGSGDDYLEGNGGADILDGGAGADMMVGGGGFGTGNNTTYYVDNVSDKCIETADGGTDRIVTSVSWTLGGYTENLTAVGSDALALTGNSLANVIVGNSGNNLIKGGAGADTLSGGAESDTFVFATKPDKKSNLDKITDFTVKTDRIWLENKVFTKLGKKGSEASPAKLNKAFFKLGDKAKDTNDYLIYNKKTGVLLYDADGSGAKYKAVEIASLKTNLKMVAADFLVI
ncbi:calcium-binding protein [Microvirga sesbaniae]|uniref:calcium-binding protein n=1 Tax=Microvirga sesbaniae TaxID=681392 RepID=UPI0021C7D590|nr:calcium-binding protein [Microvirga sp. HBU67692]